MSDYINVNGLTSGSEILNKVEQASEFQPKQDKPQQRFNSNNNRKNLWKDQDIKSIPFSTIQMIYGNKDYSIYYNDRGPQVPSPIVEKMQKLVGLMNKNGYKLRAWYPGGCSVGSAIVDPNNTSPHPLQVEWYIPTKSYNSLVTPKSLVNNELAYQLLRGFHKGWDKIPGFVRALCARDIEVFLGQDCKHPLRFVVIWSPGGEESLSGDKIDWKGLGQLAFIIRLAKELGIPLFNLAKEDSITRLGSLLNGSTVEQKPEPKPTVQEVIPTEQPVEVKEEIKVEEPTVIKIEEPVSEVPVSDNGDIII